MSLKTFDLFRKELIVGWPISIRLIISPINLDLMQTFIWVIIFWGIVTLSTSILSLVAEPIELQYLIYFHLLLQD